MPLLKSNALLAWVAVAGFLMAAAWPSLSPSALPLLGLQALAEPHVGWPLTAVAFAMAVFLSIPTFLSRDRLLICAGFSFCLFIVVAFYASPAAAIIFAFMGGNLIRESRRADAGLGSDSASYE